MSIAQYQDTTEPSDELIPLRRETLEQLDHLREEGQTYDQLVTELINIYRTAELSIAHGGDAIPG